MKNLSYVSALLFAAAGLAAALLMISGPRVEAAEADCKLEELIPCLPAISDGTPPSDPCCVKLKEQQPCLCEYLRDPDLSQYVSSPNAKKVASDCGVSDPQC